MGAARGDITRSGQAAFNFLSGRKHVGDARFLLPTGTALKILTVKFSSPKASFAYFRAPSKSLQTSAGRYELGASLLGKNETLS